jgi:hypothetical protein
MTAREHAASRGVRDSCEGKALEEGNPGTVTARNKAVKLVRAKTAEGLRQPESGAGAALDEPLHDGASASEVVEGCEDLRGGRLRPPGRTAERR